MQAKALSYLIDDEHLLLILQFTSSVVRSLELHLVSQQAINEEEVVEETHDADTIETVHDTTMAR